MKIEYQCSNCGKRFETIASVGIPLGMYALGVRANGDAVYCEDCVATWKERNGKEFDEQYKEPQKMFAVWWNRTVDKTAAREGKPVTTYRVAANGDYYDYRRKR